MLEPLKYTLSKTRVILASASPRRKDIFHSLGLDVEIKPSNAEENLDKKSYKGNPWQYAVDTSQLKVEDVFLKLSDTDDRLLVLVGADTVIAMDGDIYEKPKDKEDAARILRSFSGRSHTVYTGVTIIFRTEEGHTERIQFHEGTDVQFADLTDEVIRAYIETGEPMDKAGGYGIQGKGGSLVKGIHGDYYNVVGFPTHTFCRELTKLMSK